ncbi:MAG: 3-oxoadipate CoA-transferase [Dehalococcoidia bacterium]|nr:3-oxoadipate CoA-transferase [Dehalococcoidia bacterium]|tara:strand:- start:501 stop:1187 length:687 start_codon:yes stop_codon:yes gene_type:complete
MAPKIYPQALDALSDMSDGSVVMIGGFGGPGLPQILLKALIEHGATNLTVITNTCYLPVAGNYDIANLVETGQIKKLITTFPGKPNQNVPVVESYKNGDVEIEVIPQGVLAERMRAGAAGLGGVFLPMFSGTEFSHGKEIRVICGVKHVFEYPLKGQYALIAADKADRLGNLVYRRTQRNYNPTMAAAATTTIVQVRELVDVGGVNPELVVTPGIYVDRIVVSSADRS